MCLGAEIFRPYLFGKKNFCYLSPRLTNCTGQLYYVEMSCLNLFILCVYINYEIPPGKKSAFNDHGYNAVIEMHLRKSTTSCSLLRKVSTYR